MLVRHWMTTDLITIDEDDSLQQAVNVIKEHNVHLLPVMKNGKLVGIVTNTDLKRASASDATSLDIHELLYLISRVKIRDIMTPNPITVPPDFTVEETAEVLLANKISSVPVVDDAERIVGIITKDDIFKMLISVTALGRRGIQIAFQLEDRPGSIKEITDIIKSHGGRIASILSSNERAPEGFRIVYIRLYGVNRETLTQLQVLLREKAGILYMVDHRENRREIYGELPR